MKRSVFLVSLATTAAISTAPRLAQAQTGDAPARIVRRAALRRFNVPGGCSDHRRKLRWSGPTLHDVLN